MARKFLFAIAVVLAVVAFGPGASAANVEPEPSASPSVADVPHGPPPALADRDNNGLSDRLQAKLAAAPGDRFDVVVTFKRPDKGAGPVGTAASAQLAVGSFLVRREFKIIPGFAATMTAAQARALANVAGVFRVEEDFEVKAVLDDSRPDLGLDRIQFGAEQIVDGLGFPATGLGVKICILDTGLHDEHEMFAGRPIVWFDEVNGQPDPYDDHVDPFGTPFGHGTHVTGIAMGGQGTYLGNPISGTAWQADIIAVKVLDQNGSGPESTIIAGFDRCVASAADVISISLGAAPGGDCQDAMALAVRAAVNDHGIFVAAAAGNSGPGLQTIITPACEPKATAVGVSINWTGDGLGMSLIGFSSRGPVPAPPPIGSYIKPDVVYPGALIRSAKVNTINDYWRLSGTSMSAPGVAGLAAMALQVNPALTPDQIKTLLKDTAYDFGDVGEDNDWGAGHVNPYTFMAKVKDPAADPIPTPFQEHFMEQVNVADGGQTFSQSFEVTADDVAAGTPIAMVVTIEGTPFCPFGYPDLYCEWGIIGWDYDPDLDAQLQWDDGAPVTASGSDITLSECVFSGEACGQFKGRGRQETIRYTPLQTGSLKLRLYSFAGAGTARIERWHRLSDAVASSPPGNTAPQVNAGADGTIDEGGTFVSAGSFTDPDADAWTATVDYGDGSPVQPLVLNPDKTFNLSHAYANNGVFTVTVTVNDGAANGQDTALVTVNNVAPQVNAFAGDTINEGGTYAQSGSFTDPGSDSWTATVNYGDGSGTQALPLTGKTFNLNHVYADNGAYTVTVTVDDGIGNNQNTALVTVNNVAPQVSAGADANINEGDTFAQSGSFTDPGADFWTATVDYGDGTGVQLLALTSKTFNLSHAYTSATGSPFTVTVTVTDDDTGAGSDTVLVTVNAVTPGNTAPQVNAGAGGTINEGGTFAGSGSFTDPDADTWTATVDYGDVSGVQALALSGQTFNLSHVYADDGPYTVTVTVNDGTAAGQDTALVTVNNVAPQVNAGADANINEGDTFAQSGSFADPGADTWTATVDYGDGTPVQALALTGKTFNLSHAYTSAAGSPYTVTVTVTDDDTGAGSDPVIVTVLPVAGGIGTVSGKVQDSATGSNLQGVLVTTDRDQTATTNKQGKYSIDNVPEGSRTLTFSMTGYVTKFMNSVTVDAGSTTRNVNTTLDPDGGPDPDPVTVPNVVGDTEAAAVSMIEGVGLVASVTSKSDETIAVGIVISQDPSGGTEVAAGSTVDLVVSSGPAKGTVKGSISLSTGGKVKLANVSIVGGPSTTSGNGGKYTLDNVAAGAPITVTATKTASSITCSGEGVITPDAGGTVNLNIVMSCSN